jgi:mannose-6-phosphate isomerase class I
MKMANRHSFNPYEWQQILDSVTLAGMAVALTDYSHLGLFRLVKEMKVCSEEAMAAKDDPSANELTKAVSADFKSSVVMSEHVRKLFVAGNAPETKAKIIEALREVSSLLDAKAPRDAVAFKSWLLRIGEKVAEASKAGGLLGFGGARVSDAQEATLAEISNALGLRLGG